jgi:hypothetical protein
MSLINQVIKEDLKVAKKYVDKRPEFVNVIGNRIMSDLLVADDNDEKILMLAGWILREISGNLINIDRSENKSKFANGIAISKDYLDKLIDLVSKNSYTDIKLCELYVNYEKEIRIHILPESEDDIYTKKPEFTRKVNLHLIKHFIENKKLLLQENNHLVNGLINEMGRVINEHGAKEGDYIIFLIFKAFDKYYDYALYNVLEFDKKIENEEQLESKLNPYIDKINELVPLLIEDKNEELYKHSGEIFIDLGIEFRMNFINFSDIYIPTLKKELELPLEAKKRISESVAKAFEEETS